MSRTCLRMTMALLTLFVGLGWALQQESQPSLADVAKQKPSAKKAKKVVTNDEIPSRPQESAPQVSAAVGASGTGVAAADDKKPKQPAAQAKKEPPEGVKKKKIEELKQLEATANNVIERYQNDLDSTTDENRQRMFADTLQHAKERLQLIQQERAQLEAQAASGDKPQLQAAPTEPPKQ